MNTFSPHINAQGSLTWYEHDNFIINWTISLEKNGEKIIYTYLDRFIISFYDKNENLIDSFEINPNTEGLITIEFNQEHSKLFSAGEYTYCIKFVDSTNNNFVTTVAANKKAIVKSCH